MKTNMEMSQVQPIKKPLVTNVEEGQTVPGEKMYIDTNAISAQIPSCMLHNLPSKEKELTSTIDLGLVGQAQDPKPSDITIYC